MFRGGTLPEPVASITPTRELTDAQEVTLVGHDFGPNRAYVVQLCQASPGQVCDEMSELSAAVSDDGGLLEAVTDVHAAIYGWQGGIDCVAEQCSVVIGDRSVRLVEPPIAFDRGVVARYPRARARSPRSLHRGPGGHRPRDRLPPGANGTFTASFGPTASLPLTGSCIGEPGCVLAWVILHGPIGVSTPLDLQP